MEKRLKLLFADLEAQLTDILELHQKIEEKVKKLDKDLDNEDIKDSLAYKLHNLYCAYEDFFKIIAEFFENQIDDKKKYHILLLKRMSIKIEGIRPALLSKETFKILDELRAFRHLFRHAYSYELDPEKVLKLAKKMTNLKMLFLKDWEKFKTLIFS